MSCRAEASQLREAPRRFYKTAAAGPGGAIMLDARQLKTPGGAALNAPTQELAEAMAREWQAQGERITPSTMPLTQLAFAAVDITPTRRREIARAIAQYAETDLVAHRAETPAPLVARQAELWDPIVDWGHARFRFRVPVVTGIIAAPLSPQDRTEIEWEVDNLDDFRCTALVQAVTLAGSALIGFALLEGRLSAAAVFKTAALDELWSLENWGDDAQARARLDRQRAEFDNIARFIALLG
jgi:chaperone required for assembly of F1-ATPase